MKSLKRSFQTVIFPLILCGVSLAADRPASELPFRLYQDHLVVVRGSIGGSDRLNLLIDTGATATLIDRKLADRLKLSELPQKVKFYAYGKEGSVQKMMLPDLRIGPVYVRSLPVVAGDLSPFYNAGLSLDAIVGMDVLKLSSFTIDYRSRRISFGPIPPSATAVAVTSIYPRLIVEAEVQGQPVRLMVNTGGTDLILFRSLQARLKVRRLGDKLVYHSSGISRFKRGQLPAIRLGQTEWKELDILVSEISASLFPDTDGILAVSPLGLRRIRFDFERNAVGFER